MTVLVREYLLPPKAAPGGLFICTKLCVTKLEARLFIKLSINTAPNVYIHPKMSEG